MKKSLKKALAFLMSILMLAGVTPSVSFAAEPVHSGTVGGGGFSWSLDSDGVLYIGGQGEFPPVVTDCFIDGQQLTEAILDSFGLSFTAAPWTDYAEEITSIVIGEGVTSVGDFAFVMLTGLVSVSLPSTVSDIGMYSFAESFMLESVTMAEPEGSLSIGEYAFSYDVSLEVCEPIRYATEICEEAFCICVSLTEIDMYRAVSVASDAFSSTICVERVRLPETLEITEPLDLESFALERIENYTAGSLFDLVDFGSIFFVTKEAKDKYADLLRKYYKVILPAEFMEDVYGMEYILETARREFGENIRSLEEAEAVFGARIGRLEEYYTTRNVPSYLCLVLNNNVSDHNICKERGIHHCVAGKDCLCFEGLSGKYGNDIGWTVNPETRTLTISGTGNMPETDPDWNNYMGLFDSVVFAEDSSITGISSKAFSKTAIKSIALPASLTTLGSGLVFGPVIETITVDTQNTVFSVAGGALIMENNNETCYCVYPSGKAYVESYTLPEGLDRIDSMCFECADIGTIIIPENTLLYDGTDETEVYSSFGLAKDVFVYEDECLVSPAGIFNGTVHCHYDSLARESCQQRGVKVSVIEDKNIKSIEITNLPERITVDQYQSPVIDYEFEIEVTFRDNTKELRNYGYTISDFDTTTPGRKSVALVYNGFSTDFDVTVTPYEEIVITDINATTTGIPKPGRNMTYVKFVPEKDCKYTFNIKLWHSPEEPEENPNNYYSVSAYFYDADHKDIMNLASYGATCSFEKGKTYYIGFIGVSGYSYVTIDAECAHIFSRRDISVPTCTNPGESVYTCETCGRVFYGEVPASHTDADFDGVCDVCGEDSGIEITWSESEDLRFLAYGRPLLMEYTATGIEEYILAGSFGNDRGEGPVVKMYDTVTGEEVHLTSSGANYYFVSGLTAGRKYIVTMTQFEGASVQKSITISHSHKTGRSVVTKQPTCTSYGEKRVYCTVDGCGYSNYETYGNPSGHDYKSVVEKTPTCTEPGRVVKTCKNCGEVVTTYPLGHVDSNNDGVCELCNNEIVYEIKKNQSITIPVKLGDRVRVYYDARLTESIEWDVTLVSPTVSALRWTYNGMDEWYQGTGTSTRYTNPTEGSRNYIEIYRDEYQSDLDSQTAEVTVYAGHQHDFTAYPDGNIEGTCLVKAKGCIKCTSCDMLRYVDTSYGNHVDADNNGICDVCSKKISAKLELDKAKETLNSYFGVPVTYIYTATATGDVEFNYSAVNEAGKEGNAQFSVNVSCNGETIREISYTAGGRITLSVEQGKTYNISLWQSYYYPESYYHDYNVEYYTASVTHAHYFMPDSSKEATCTTEGYQKLKCTMCDEIFTVWFPCLGHIDEDADCKCDRCSDPTYVFIETDKEYKVGANDFHGFRYTAGHTAEYTFESFALESGTDPYCEIRDENRNYVTSDDDGGEEGNFKVVAELVAGETYFFDITGNATVKLTADLEGHNITDLEAIPGTCTEAGHEAGKYCEGCGCYISGGAETVTDENAHEYEYVSNGDRTHSQVCKLDPSHIGAENEACEFETAPSEGGNNGIIRYVCKKCGYSYEEEAPVCEHDYTVSTKTPATCTDGGEKLYHCKKCGYEYTEPTEALNHSYNYADAVYDWSDDYSTCTATVTCRNDSSHKVTMTVDTTCEHHDCNCLEEGYNTYFADFGSSDFENQTIEKANLVPAKGHDFIVSYKWDTGEDGKVSCKAIATCTCGLDGSVIEENAAITSEDKKAATCSEEGIVSYTATFENDAFLTKHKDFSTPVDPEAHDWDYTFNAETKTHSAVCKNDPAHVIDETPCDFTSEVTTEPSCTAKGVRTYTCNDCGGKYTEEINAVPHSYGSDWIYDETNHWHKCENCDATTSEAHTWGEGAVTTEPTYAADGVKTYTCKCGATKTEKVDKLTCNVMADDLGTKGADYKTIVTVSITINNVPAGAKVYIDGKEATVSSNTYSASLGQLTSDKTCKVEIKQGNTVIEESSLKVSVDGGIFARIASFFSNFLFNLFKWKETTVKF